MDKPHSEAIRRLQEIAEEDLRVAHACLELRPSAIRMAAYHSQQAAEKHLKAWLVGWCDLLTDADAEGVVLTGHLIGDGPCVFDVDRLALDKITNGIAQLADCINGPHHEARLGVR